MIIDFEERREKTAEKDFLQTLSQAISTAALIDITQEIQTVVNFMGGIKEQSGAEIFSAQDPVNKKQEPARRADLLLLAYMCEKQSKNLMGIAAAAKKATGAPTAAEMETARNAGEELAKLYPEQHETILQKYVSNLTNIE